MIESPKQEIYYKRKDSNNLNKENNDNKLKILFLKLYSFFPSLFSQIKLYLIQIFFKKNNSTNVKVEEEKNQRKEFIYDNKEIIENYKLKEFKDNSFYINNNFDYSNKNQNIYSQTQMQVSKQKLRQLDSQTYSNNTMARMICCAELYALSLNIESEQMYKKYDEFDNSNRKNSKELKGELILQIKCFQISLKSYTKDYNKYDFPYDYDEEKTLDELEKIKNNINSEDKKYYDAIIKLLKEDTNIPSFDDELEELLKENEEDNGKLDPKLQLETHIPIMRYVDKTHKVLKEKYLQNPLDCKVKLDLDIPIEKNEELQILVKKIDERKREVKKKNLGINQKNEKRIYNKIKRCISYDKLIAKNKNNKEDTKEIKRSNSGIIPIKKQIEKFFIYNDNINYKKYSYHLEFSDNSDCNCCNSSDEEEKLNNHNYNNEEEEINYDENKDSIVFVEDMK